MKAKILASTKGMKKEDWLMLRRQGIGGSDASSILGLNPYSSAYAVYMDKMGLAPEVEENEAIWTGREMENAIIRRTSAELGVKVQKRHAILQNPVYPWMLANIDAWIPSLGIGVEAKSTSSWNHSDFANGEIPANYYCQATHYMATTGASEWVLSVAVLGKSFHLFRIKRDEAEITALIEAERLFWNEYVMKNVPPPPDGSLSVDNLIRARFPQAKADGQLVALFGLEDKVEQILDLEGKIKQLERESSRLKQIIELEIASADGGVTQNHYVYFKSQSRSSIDGQKLKANQPEIYQQYLKSTSYRKFDIRKKVGGEISA